MLYRDGVLGAPVIVAFSNKVAAHWDRDWPRFMEQMINLERAAMWLKEAQGPRESDCRKVVSWNVHQQPIFIPDSYNRTAATFEYSSQ